jgi:SAM-dependent methyltransferase
MRKKNELIERIISVFKYSVIFCNTCGGARRIRIKTKNYREDCICKNCHSSSRKRHIAAVLLETINTKYNLKTKSLSKIPASLNTNIYNLESNGALHTCLKHTKEYICSEYFGTMEAFGAEQNGVLNVDVMNTPFKDEQFNYIISTEVFEHIPHPYKAFKETHRILKTGGSHIFTIPYHQDADKDEIKAILNDKNEIVHLMEPEYHGDPIRKDDGILVFTIFSKEMHTKLEEMGFSVKLDHRRDYEYGIIGDNNFVFTATKL